MQKRYIKKLDMSLSPLGFGVMRLYQNADGSFPQEAHTLLSAAYEKGINFFDTAYFYLGGNSETLIRDSIVNKYPRDSFYISDKMPVWDCKDIDDMERVFAIQLDRLGVDYIDFYLLHALQRQRWFDIRDKGVIDFLNKKRNEGKILKAGFSLHDNRATLDMILNEFDWDFSLLQINYYDWIIQRAKDNYALLLERGIPCFVMEPVGGGRLSKLPEKAEELLKGITPDASISSWALRFVAGLPNVAVTLSGMNSMAQLEDNIATFSPIVPLSDGENAAINKAVDIFGQCNAITCSSCMYCADECPELVDIPHIFQIYNDWKMFSCARSMDIEYFAVLADGRRADSCISCGKCVEKCPQSIDIPQELKRIHDTAIGLSIGIDIDKLRSKDNIVLFGSGADGRRALSLLKEAEIGVIGFCDNNPKLWGGSIDGVEVLSPQKLPETETTVLITSSKYHDAIKEQLADMGISAVNA